MTLIKPAPNLRLRRIGGRNIVVGLPDGDMGVDVFELNHTAAWVWHVIEERPLTREALCERLCAHYGVERRVAGRDVALLLEQWAEAGLLCRCEKV